MRRAASTDANQGEIVRALRKAGCSVLDLSRVGEGCPDILAARAGVNVLIEIKRPKTKGQPAGTLTDDQKEFLRMWRGKVHVVDSVEAAYRAVGLIRTPSCPAQQNGPHNGPWEGICGSMR